MRNHRRCGTPSWTLRRALAEPLIDDDVYLADIVAAVEYA